MDVLYHKNGEVSEVSRSNFFVVKNGTVITPDKHVLYGITRKKTIQLAKEICPVEERTVTIGEVANADECFITGTTKKVMPVVEIDGKPIGNGKPGRITRQLMALFRDFEENY